MSYAFFVKRVVGTGDARPFLAAEAFSRQPYASLIFFLAMKRQHPLILPSHFVYFLPQEEALVVGIWSFALIERIFLFSRRDAEKIDISCLAAALLDHL